MASTITTILAASALVVAGTSEARADEEPPSVVRARVVSYEDTETLERLACGLVAIADVGAHARLFDISVDGKRCSSLTPQNDALPLRVRLEPRDDGRRTVVFEADVPEGIGAAEMSASVDAAARELFDRVSRKPRATHAVIAEKPSEPKGSAARGGGVALMVVGGLSLGAAAFLGVTTAVMAGTHSFGCAISSLGGASCSRQDLSGLEIGTGVSAALGALLLVSGGVLLSMSRDKTVSAQLGPTGGSLRVTF